MQFKHPFFLLVAVFFLMQTNAQEPVNYHGAIDLAFGAGQNQNSAALSYAHYFHMGKSKKFRVGVGARFSSYIANNQNYITAPAKLTSGKAGPQVIFTEILNENLDTFSLASAQVNALNLQLVLHYQITQKLGAGFDIDVAGVSFGAKQQGNFESSVWPQANSNAIEAKPTAPNLLLTSDNDWGTLNSEFYVSYQLRDKVSLRAGLQFLFTEYTTSVPLVFDNDRFRNKSSLGFLAINFNLY